MFELHQEGENQNFVAVTIVHTLCKTASPKVKQFKQLPVGTVDCHYFLIHKSVLMNLYSQK